MVEYREHGGERPLSFDIQTQTLTLAHPDQRQALEEKIGELEEKQSELQENNVDFYAELPNTRNLYKIGYQLRILDGLMKVGEVNIETLKQEYLKEETQIRQKYPETPGWRNQWRRRVYFSEELYDEAVGELMRDFLEGK